MYCLLIAAFMLVAHTLQLRRPMGEPASSRLKLISLLDLLVVVIAGLVIGMALRGDGPLTVLGLRISYVLVDRAQTSPDLFAFASRTLGLTKFADDGERALYVVRPARHVQLLNDPPAFLDSIAKRSPRRVGY